jgi:hypothetical protein
MSLVTDRLLCAARAVKVVLATTLALAAGAGCFLYTPTTADMYPTMTPEAEAVRIYYAGDEPECTEVFSLGRVQAKAGEGPLFREPTKVNMDVALAWLKVEAAKLGANGVKLVNQRGNQDATVHVAFGEAIFCRTAN